METLHRERLLNLAGHGLTPPGQAKNEAVEAVLLDVDGTLIDSMEAHVETWATVLREFGGEAPRAQLRQQMGKAGGELMRVFLSEAECRRNGEAIKARCRELFKARYLPHLKALPGTRELVMRLQGEGRRVILASCAGGEALEQYQRLAKIDDLVHESVSREDVERSKPQPDLFEVALSRLDGMPRERVLVIGASPCDAEAAGRAGLRSVGFLSGGFAGTRLREAGCLEVYRDALDLVERYEESVLGPR